MKINSGIIKVEIERDDEPVRYISFNPSDIEFANKFYSLISEFEIKHKEFKQRLKDIKESKEADSFGLSVNSKEILDIQKELCVFMRDKIDNLFGEGTSEIAFGNTLSIEVFEQFFEGVIPHIEESRKSKINKYTQRKVNDGVMQ